MPTTQGLWRKREQKGPDDQSVCLSSKYYRDAASMKSQQYGCLDKTYTVTMPVDSQ